MAKFFVKFFRIIRNKKVAGYVPPGKDILDVGCGNDFYLLDSLKGKIHSGTGIDTDVQNAKKGNLSIRKVRVGSKLPFADNKFDAVTMIAFLEHIDRPAAILKECRRVLRKGGMVIITTPTGRAKPFWEVLVNLGMTEEKTTKDHKHYFSKAEVEKLLSANGFSIEVSKTFELGMNYIAVGRKTGNRL